MPQNLFWRVGGGSGGWKRLSDAVCPSIARCLNSYLRWEISLNVTKIPFSFFYLNFLLVHYKFNFGKFDSFINYRLLASPL